MKNIRSCAIAGALIIVSLCLLGVGFYFLSLRVHMQAFNSRPLVIIHNPLNRDLIKVGDAAVVHATARSQTGIARMELWVDNILVAERNAETGTPAKSLILSADWVPSNAGNHNIVVRAISTNKVNGQSSVSLTAVDDGGSITYRIQEGETLETISSDFETTPEELVSLNPGLDPSGIAPGSSLVVSEGDAPPAGEETLPGSEVESPVEEETPPESEDEAPFLWADAPDLSFLFFGIFESVETNSEPGRPIRLRTEVISLRTSATYEGLHCYIGLMGNTPNWYPDLDRNPGTDESFSVLNGAGGDGAGWNVRTYLSGENAPTLFWTANQPIPFEISCVGIAGGGTEALELGRLALEIPPEQWTGVTLSGDATGADGSFSVSYRVKRLGIGEQGVTKELDPNMTSPTNLRAASYYALIAPVGDGGNFFVTPNDPVALLWDHNPAPGEVPASGFLIYLNGNLIWTERADRLMGSTHYTVLPAQWQHPPCSEQYVITVSAWRPGGTDGYESPTADPPIVYETPAEDCVRRAQITFLELRTYNLGGDGDEGDRTGDVGPAYGHFFANEEIVTFSGGTLGRDHYGGIDTPYGLSHYTEYDLNEIFSTWISSGPPTLNVRIPQGDNFEFGFHIMDEDSGRCRNSDDRGCPDPICDGTVTLYADMPNEYDNYHNELDRETEGTIQSQDGRCEVTYRLGPAAGSPVGFGDASDGEALPWIDVEDIAFDEAGNAHIHVRNTGTAAWPIHDLTVELQSREGLSLSIYTWPEFSLDPGQEKVLESPDMRLSAPLDACALIDPYNDVSEERELSGGRQHSPFCPDLPDLLIHDVKYDPRAGGINVTVWNLGPGDVVNRALSIRTYLPDGSQLPISAELRNISLIREGDSAQTFLINIPESERPNLQGGYSVVVNPDNAIVEDDTTNNAFIVPASTQLMIRMIWMGTHYHYRESTEYYFTAFAGSGAERRQVADFHFDFGDLEDFRACGDYSERYGNQARTCSTPLFDPYGNYYTPWFPVAGDERLEINVRITHRGSFDTTVSYVWPLNDPHINPSAGSRLNCNDLTSHNVRATGYELVDSNYRESWLSFQVCTHWP